MEHTPIMAYVHIPFCTQKCHYCSFFSLPLVRGEEQTYLSALGKEIVLSGQQETPLASIYVGGGTPSCLPPAAVADILTQLQLCFSLEEGCETTVEANPESFSAGHAEAWKRAGANRISFGVQSLDDRVLHMLGRQHRKEEVMRAVAVARRAGFTNINLDLIYGIPYQSMEQWEETLREVCRMGVQHLSCYALSIEETTPFFTMQRKGVIPSVDDDLAADMSQRAETLLSDYGYRRYEISNYAQPGQESRHNTGYWQGSRYYGFGAGAHGYLARHNGPFRYHHAADIDGYGNEIAMEKLFPNCEEQSLQEECFTAIMMATRMVKGLHLGVFQQRFRRQLESLFPTTLHRSLEQGLAEIAEGHYRLTTRGLEVQNRILLWFMAEMETWPGEMPQQEEEYR